MRFARRAMWMVVAVGAGWWLFADTVRYHWAGQRDDRLIRFSHWGTYQEYQMWRQIVAAFEKAEPRIHVRQEYVVAVRYQTKIQQQLVAGDAPDVFLFQDEPFPNFAPKGFAVLDDFLQRDGIDLRRDYFDSAVESFMIDGRLRGMPLWGGDNLIYCNKRCFDRAATVRGRPVPLPSDDWTLDDFVRIARDLTIDEDGDGRIDQFGFGMPTWLYGLPLMWAQGMHVLDPTRTRWAMTGPEAQRAWGFYQDLRFKYHVCPTAVEQGEMNTDTAFFTGRVAMVSNGPWIHPMLRGTGLKDDYVIVHMPRGPAGRVTRVTWDGLVINEGSSPRRKEAAWKFVRFVCGPAGQAIIARYQRLVPALRQGARVFVECDSGEGSRKFVEALEYARLQPISRHWNVMDRAIWRHTEGLMSEKPPRQTPGQFLTGLADDPVIRRCFGYSGKKAFRTASAR